MLKCENSTKKILVLFDNTVYNLDCNVDIESTDYENNEQFKNTVFDFKKDGTLQVCLGGGD